MVEDEMADVEFFVPSTEKQNSLRLSLHDLFDRRPYVTLTRVDLVGVGEVEASPQQCPLWRISSTLPRTACPTPLPPR